MMFSSMGEHVDAFNAIGLRNLVSTKIIYGIFRENLKQVTEACITELGKSNGKELSLKERKPPRQLIAMINRCRDNHYSLSFLFRVGLSDTPRCVRNSREQDIDHISLAMSSLRISKIQPISTTR